MVSLVLAALSLELQLRLGYNINTAHWSALTLLFEQTPFSSLAHWHKVDSIILILCVRVAQGTRSYSLRFDTSAPRPPDPRLRSQSSPTTPWLWTRRNPFMNDQFFFPLHSRFFDYAHSTQIVILYHYYLRSPMLSWHYLSCRCLFFCSCWCCFLSSWRCGFPISLLSYITLSIVHFFFCTHTRIWSSNI